MYFAVEEPQLRCYIATTNYSNLALFLWKYLLGLHLPVSLQLFSGPVSFKSQTESWELLHLLQTVQKKKKKKGSLLHSSPCTPVNLR